MHINNKGQAVIELAGAYLFLMVLVFGIIVLGIYFYDMSLYSYAVNKALDKGIAISMSRNLTAQDKTDIENDALNYASPRLFASKPQPNAQITVNNSTKQGTITVSMKGAYNCNLPFVTSPPTISAKSTYVYKIN